MFTVALLLGRNRSVLWTPDSSWKGPLKWDLSVHLSFQPTIQVFSCSRIISFCKFWQGARDPCKIVFGRARFPRIFFLPQNWENWQKMAKSRVFDFIEKFGHFSKNVWVGLVKTELLNKIWTKNKQKIKFLWSFYSYVLNLPIPWYSHFWSSCKMHNIIADKEKYAWRP